MCGGGGGGGNPTMGSKTNPMLPRGTKAGGVGPLRFAYSANQQKAAVPVEPPAPTPTPTAPPYDPGPYGPRITVATAPAGMPNAGNKTSTSPAEALQVSADAIRRNRSFYRTAGMSGLNIPGAA